MPVAKYNAGEGGIYDRWDQGWDNTGDERDEAIQKMIE